MPHFSIQLEPIPGPKLEDILYAARDIARQLHMAVCFTFNGVRFSISPDADIESALRQYYQVYQLGEDERWVVA